MKDVLKVIGTFLIIVLVACYFSLIALEYARYQRSYPMLVILKEKETKVKNGSIYEFYGLGYKKIIYDLDNFEGKEFGHLFIKIKDKYKE